MNMKWLLLSAITLVTPIVSEAKTKDPTKATEQQPVPFDADLFRKEEQVYSGHASLLYWTVAESALDYATQMTQPVETDGTSYNMGNVQNGTYDMDPGVRVALSYFRATHYWELKWQYTRMTNRGHNSVQKPHQDDLFVTATFPTALAGPIAKATSHQHLNYNVFDMLVDRVFFPNPHLRLRVWGGASLAWMSQDWKVRYEDSALNSTVIRNRWDYVAGGLKMGTAVDWYWTWDLYLTAEAYFGTFIGGYSNSALTKLDLSVEDEPITIGNANYSDVRPSFTTQAIFGPSWQKNFKKNRVEVFAGFEANIWMNVQEVYRSTGAAGASPSNPKETWLSTGMLALYGVTARATVDF